jgi:hypothetical protein
MLTLATSGCPELPLFPALTLVEMILPSNNNIILNHILQILADPTSLQFEIGPMPQSGSKKFHKESSGFHWTLKKGLKLCWVNQSHLHGLRGYVREWVNRDKTSLYPLKKIQFFFCGPVNRLPRLSSCQGHSVGLSSSFICSVSLNSSHKLPRREMDDYRDNYSQLTLGTNVSSGGQAIKVSTR